MQEPSPMEKGQPLVRSVLSKINEILEYLGRSRVIAGNGIRLTETSSGIILDAADSRQAAGSPAAGNDYRGPFQLFLQNGKIRCRGGFVWRGGSCQYLSERYADIPSESGCLILGYDSNLYTFTFQNEETYRTHLSDSEYWVTHAVLGYYDADAKTLIQYHYGPVIYMIEVEPFVEIPQ